MNATIKTERHTVSNDFHGTTATFVGSKSDGGFVRVSYRTYRRVRRELCGIAECCCGNHGPYCEPVSGEFGGDWRIKVS